LMRRLVDSESASRHDTNPEPREMPGDAPGHFRTARGWAPGADDGNPRSRGNATPKKSLCRRLAKLAEFWREKAVVQALRLRSRGDNRHRPGLGRSGAQLRA